MAVSGYGKTSSKQYFLRINREAPGAMLMMIGCFCLWSLEIGKHYNQVFSTHLLCPPAVDFDLQ